MLRTQSIPNSNVLLCLDGEDIAFVISINHTPKLWTIHIPSSDGHNAIPTCTTKICMQTYIMKVFKMLHPNIPNGAIIRDMGTFHVVHKGLATVGHMVCDDLPNQKVNIKKK